MKQSGHKMTSSWVTSTCGFEVSFYFSHGFEITFKKKRLVTHFLLHPLEAVGAICSLDYKPAKIWELEVSLYFSKRSLYL